MRSRLSSLLGAVTALAVLVAACSPSPTPTSVPSVTSGTPGSSAGGTPTISPELSALATQVAPTRAAIAAAQTREASSGSSVSANPSAAVAVSSASAVAQGAATSAAPTEGGPITLTFWHGMQGVQETTIKALVEQYKQVQPNVTITLDYTSYTGGALQQKVMGAIAANSRPDIVQGFPNDIAAWYDAGAVQPLDEYLKGTNGLSAADMDDLYPSLVKEGQFPQYQNQTLAFPFNKSLDGVIIYNVPVVKAAGYDTFPTTWDAFEDLCSKVTTADRQCYALQPSASRTMIEIYAHGGQVLAPDLKTVAFAPAVQQWFEREKSLVDKGYAYVVRDFSWQNDLAAGRVVASATTTAGDPFIENLVQGAFEYGFAPMPAGPGGKPGMSISGTNLVMFKSNAAKQQAAWDFIKWLTQKEQTLTWATATGYLPLRKSATDDPSYQAFLTQKPRFKVAMDQLPQALSEPPLAAWSEIRNYLLDDENKVTSLTMSPVDAAKELTTRANAALGR